MSSLEELYSDASKAMPASLAGEYMQALLLERYRLLVKPRVIPVTAPAAGADFTIVVPGGVVWVPLSLTALLTASATVANRVPILKLDDANTTVFAGSAWAAQTASQVIPYSWARFWGAQQSALSSSGVASPIFAIPLVQNMRMLTSTQNIQVGDQWSAIGLYVLELRERQPNELVRYVQDILNGARSDPYPGVLSAL